MSKIFKKSNIMPVIVLTVICIVIAAVLGVTNMLTEERIAFNENQKKYESLKVVIDGAFEPIDKPAGAPESVQDVYKATDSSGKLIGYAVTLKVQGYASEISLTVGVSTDGSVTKAVVTSQAESHGKPGMANYTDNFTGVAKDEVANVDTFSGATVSSTAIKNAIIDAVNTVTGNVSEEEPEIPLPRDESEIIAAAKTLLGKDDVLLTNVTPEDMEYALRIYKAGNEGYVAYTVVMSRYGYPETETLIHVGNNGAIKSVNKLVWKTSDAVEGLYQPPTADVVDAFYAKLSGKKASDLKAFENTDLVSNATNTSTNLRDALVEALEAIEALILKDMPTPEEQLIPMINELVGAETELTDVTPDGMKYARRIYKAGNLGYVAYTVVISSNYGTVETETLTYVGNNGVINNVKKIIWKTSDMVETPYYSYYPPSEETVNAFYAKLIGKKLSDLKAFEATDLVSNATNTSTNLRDAIAEGLEAIEALILKDMPTPEEQLIPMINELVGAETELTDVTPDGMKYARRIYKAGNLGYVAYTVVISSNYGTVETETLTYVGNNGVINNVKKIIWKTSDMVETPYYSYYPPSEETVNAFYAKLIGKKASDLKSFEAPDLVSNATNTSTNLRDALVEGLEEIEILIRNDMPTAEADVKALANTLIGKEAEFTDVTPAGTQYVRRIWSVGDDGYIVYAVVISSNYGTVETETLVHVGNDGVIKNVKKMIWKTSDMVETPYYSYYPPSEETVNAFYAKLIGKKASDLKAFETTDLVSNATNTSTSLRDAIAEGLEAVETIEASKCCDKDSVNYTARILGISLLVVAILGFAAYKIVPEIKKRRKNG